MTPAENSKSTLSVYRRVIKFIHLTTVKLPFQKRNLYHHGMSTQRFPIDERWSKTLAKRGWSAVPSVFLNFYSRLGMTPTEAMLVLHIMSFKWDARLPYPSVRALGEKLGLSDSQVRALIRRLEKKKLLRRIRRTGMSNEFDVQPLIDALEEELSQHDLDETARQMGLRNVPEEADLPF